MRMADKMKMQMDAMRLGYEMMESLAVAMYNRLHPEGGEMHFTRDEIAAAVGHRIGFERNEETGMLHVGVVRVDEVPDPPSNKVVVVGPEALRGKTH